MDKSLLVVVPEAPRISEQGFPPSFDWKFLPPKFYNSAMKPANSEMNLKSNFIGNGMKVSTSAFKVLSLSNSNVNEVEREVGNEVEEFVDKTNVEELERPRTFK